MRGADVVKNLYDTYAKRDIEGALVDCADDIVFRWVAGAVALCRGGQR
ncbi:MULTISPECIES: hypothetical protein [unclassified Mesorhizobium]|nr:MULTISPECIES: hypothetical protein [unclassified Mesorhizobium]